MKKLNSLVDAMLNVEKLRVSSEIRMSHLKRQEVTDPDTEELHRRLVSLEEFIDGRVADLLTHHPAHHWFSCVKGIGKENIAKILGLVDIEKATTVSSLWKFAGFAVEDGHAPKRTKGEKLSYNSQLRSMCWRVGVSLMRARGKFYDYYLNQKERYIQNYKNIDYRIVPATSLPTKSGKRYEPEGTISEGHVHNQALRKTIKLFLACLWLVWREGEGLPVTRPYSIDQLGHDSFIVPWQMVDLERRKQ